MGDSDTFRHATTRPIGPNKRESVPRMNDQDKWMSETIMGQKSNKRRTRSTTNSSPTTPPHSTPNKSQNSSKLEEELKKQKDTPPSRIYPDLSTFTDNFLRESTPATPSRQSSSSRSFTQTDSSNNSFCSENSEKIGQTSLYDSKFDSKPPTHTPRREDSHVLNWLQNNSIVWVLVALIFLALAWYFALLWRGSSQTEKTFNRAEFQLKIKDLKKLFPSQDQHIWGHFGTGIADVRTGEHRLAIFVLLALQNGTTNCLAQKVAELARYTLSGTGDVVLSPDKLENDTGKVLNFMESRMNRTKAVVVTDILSIQPEALKAFHDICDEYSPVVSETVYVFTMSSGRMEETENSRLFAEELTNKFSKAIVEDTLRALITRLTAGAVLAIKEEKSIPCSE